MNTEYVLNRVCPALESGEYAQTGGKLRDQSGYCCLGVMVDLSLRDGLVEGTWIEPSFQRGGYWVLVRGHAVGDVLPDAVRRLVGFGGEEGPGVTIGEGRYVSLAAANDDDRTFAEIAAALRGLAEAEIETATR